MRYVYWVLQYAPRPDKGLHVNIGTVFAPLNGHPPQTMVTIGFDEALVQRTDPVADLDAICAMLEDITNRVREAECLADMEQIMDMLSTNIRADGPHAGETADPKSETLRVASMWLHDHPQCTPKQDNPRNTTDPQ